MATLFSTIRNKARLTTAVFFFVSGILSGAWSSRIPDIQQKFGLNDADWGVVLFMLPLGLFFGLSVSSWLITRYTSVKIMVVAGVIFCLLLCLVPLMPNVVILAIALFCYGLSRNLFNISINTNALEVQRLYRKPVISTFHGVWSLASLAAAGVGAVMIAHNILPVYHFVAMAFVAFLLIVFFRQNRQQKVTRVVTRRPFFIKPDRYLVLLGVITFCTMICEGTMFDWSINYFTNVLQADKKFVTAGYIAFIAAMTAGRLAGDKLTAYFGAFNLLMINGVLMAAGFAIAIIFPSLWPATIGFLLIGLGDATLIPVIYSLAGLTKRMQPAYAISSVTMIGYLGFVSGPLIVGNISDAWGMRYSFGLMVFFSLLLTTVAYFSKKYRLSKAV